MKKLVLAAAIFLGATTIQPTALAANEEFSLTPDACIESIAYFLEDRLYDSRSARIKLNGDPYRVAVDMRSEGDITLWAVDVFVKSRLPSGSWSNYQPYTVIFQNGEAIALESEVLNLSAI